MDKKLSVLSVLMLIMAAGLILFWIGFFTVGLAPENPPSCYFAYEHSFPVPDIMLAITLTAAAMLLRKGNPLGKRLSLVCAGALFFLGILDMCFNAQNGVYASSTMDLVSNLFINIACVVLGLLIVFQVKE
jgi:hypothetical protein